MRAVLLLGVFFQLSAWGYFSAWPTLAPTACQKEPVKDPSVTGALLFYRYVDAPKFLTELGRELMSHQRAYLDGVASELGAPEETELLSAFAMTALRPFFDAMPDPRLQRNYVPALRENLKCLSDHYQLQGLSGFRGIEIAEALAFRMLSLSLASAKDLLWNHGATSAEEISGLLNLHLEQGSLGLCRKVVESSRSSLERISDEMEANSFLAGRAKVTGSLVSFLLNP